MPREIIDIIRSRRSTRSFEDRPVPREYLSLLLEAAIWAPRSLWDFGEFLHIHAKIPINGAPRTFGSMGVCKV
ncbi:MAG: nitroreductase family protein [Treponema sp.]|jgi:nitroreductase|nr:nitroreductase family protein [Treponema sp.]